MNRRPPRTDGFVHDNASRLQNPARFLRPDPRSFPERGNPRPEQDLRGVDVSDSRGNALIHENRPDRPLGPRHALMPVVGRNPENIGPLSLKDDGRLPRFSPFETTEPSWILIDEPLGVSPEDEFHMNMVRVRPIGWEDHPCPGHPQSADEPESGRRSGLCPDENENFPDPFDVFELKPIGFNFPVNQEFRVRSVSGPVEDRTPEPRQDGSAEGFRFRKFGHGKRHSFECEKHSSHYWGGCWPDQGVPGPVFISSSVLTFNVLWAPD